MECIVCTELLDSSVSACIPCGHVFHLDCLGTWLTEHKNCPMCRKEYGPSDMQILYLPKDDTVQESATTDEEIKKKWEIYTISDKVKKSQLEDEIMSAAASYPSSITAQRQNEEDIVNRAIAASYETTIPAQRSQPNEAQTTEEDIVNRVTAASSTSNVVRSQPTSYRPTGPSLRPELTRIQPMRPNNTNTSGRAETEEENDDCECGGGRRRRRRRREKANPVTIGLTIVVLIIVFIITISTAES